MDFENRMCHSPSEVASIDLVSGNASSLLSAGTSSARILPVILSGGSGSRLWPYSTEDTPKQFLSFTGAQNLFQLTLERVQDRARFKAPIVVGNIRHRDLCEREFGEADAPRLILEPLARNTAAAIAMAAAAALQTDGEDALLLVMPSDHVIEDVASFHEGVKIGEAAARAGNLVTFGIRPTGPDTGYGYLEMGPDLPGHNGIKQVLRFLEKPHAELAAELFMSGNHLWNAGIFLFRVGTFFEEIMLHAPAIGAAAQEAIAHSRRAGMAIIADEGPLRDCPCESVDYAVMEHSSRVAVLPIAPGWSDLGSWDALAQLLESSAAHGPITTLDCNDCYIRSDGLQVAALGVRDLIIVASGQRLLILPRGRSQEVKQLLSAMETMAA
jgi:mannose-1-phosphate guanylyltransferase